MSPDARSARHYILGTAGHIDHGKSALVRALTGVDPDRLPEEQARGMTIELGFAPLRIGEWCFGIVDVPGHEKFVRTMVAGATGIDLALLVVAADDGVMPQTREHAQILDLLGIDRGCIVVTKIDAVAPARVEVVRGQIEELVAGTGLAGFPVVPVSSTERTGLDELQKVLAERVEGLEKKSDSSVFRMAVDRVFAVRGRGTVVTGSVLSGRAEPGESLELLPAGRTVKVREVQSHGHREDSATGGQRAALNLAGIKHEQVRRGYELATPGFLRPTHYFDASIRVLADCAKPVLSHGTVRLCVGTTETLARLVVFDGNQAAPGESGWVQLRPSEPVVCQHGQRFILRHETGSHTLGGGAVLRPVSWRSAARLPENRKGLDTLRAGPPLERLSEVLRRTGAGDCTDLYLACQAGVEPSEVESLRSQLLERNVLVTLGGSKRVWHRDALVELQERTSEFLRRWHARHKNEPGFPADRFLTRLGRRAQVAGRQGPADQAKLLRDYLVARGAVRLQGAFVCHPDFTPSLSAEDQAMLASLLNRYRRAAFQPPTVSELKKELGRSYLRAERMIQHALSRQQLVRIDADLLLHADAYQRLQERVSELIRSEGPVTVGQVRQALNSTRKFVVPFLEHLDKIGCTRRTGDRRTLA